MKTLVLLRHGETQWNSEGRFQGQTDIPLNEAGIHQAHDAARHWGHTEFDRAIASPLERTHQTAQIMLRNRDIPMTTDKDLMETFGGQWEGKLFTEIAELWPDEHAQYRLPNINSGPVDGETPHQSGSRTASVILETLEDSNVLLVVSHGNTLRAAAHLLLGYPAEDYGSVPRLSNCRAHVLQSNSGKLGSFTLTQTSV